MLAMMQETHTGPESIVRAFQAEVGPMPPGSPEEMPKLIPSWLTCGTRERLFFYEGGNPLGTDCLFIHGLGGWAESWMPVLAPFRGFRWLIPDLPGFGRSSAPSAFDSDAYIHALLRLLDASGVERTVVVANSLGGGLALKLALEHPERVSHLILATAAGILPDLPLALRLARLPGVGELALSHIPLIFRARWQAQVGKACRMGRSFLERLLEFSIAHDTRRTWLGLVRGMVGPKGIRETVTARLHRLKQPTLLFWGDADPVLPYSHAIFAQSQVQDLQLVTVKGGGHYPHWEAPEVFNTMTTRFLVRHGLSV